MIEYTSTSNWVIMMRKKKVHASSAFFHAQITEAPPIRVGEVESGAKKLLYRVLLCTHVEQFRRFSEHHRKAKKSSLH